MTSPLLRPTESVTLSDGRKIRVGKVAFGAFAEAAESPTLGGLLAAAGSNEAAESGRRVLSTLPRLIEIGLWWSTEPRMEASSLDASDARALFEAFLRINPPSQILAEAKKWLGPAMGPLTEMLAGVRTGPERTESLI